jgi:hypothetical protein
VNPTTPEGILYAEISANIWAQITEIIIDPDTTKIEPGIRELLASYESKGLAALEDAWTEQYDRIVSNVK